MAVGIKYGTVGVLDRRARTARSHHLPARRYDRWPPRSRRLRGFPRRRPGAPRLHHERHCVPPATSSLEGSIRGQRRHPCSRWSGRWEIRPNGSRKIICAFFGRSALPPDSTSPSTPYLGGGTVGRRRAGAAVGRASAGRMVQEPSVGALGDAAVRRCGTRWVPPEPGFPSWRSRYARGGLTAFRWPTATRSCSPRSSAETLRPCFAGSRRPTPR